MDKQFLLTLNKSSLDDLRCVKLAFLTDFTRPFWKICFLIESPNVLFFVKRLLTNCKGVPYPFSLLNCFTNFRFFEDSGNP